MIGYDIDGVLKNGVKPSDGCVVISGRTFAEYDDTCRDLASKYPVYIRGSGDFGDRKAAGLFKSMMINCLGVTTFYEDDALQIEIILNNCPNIKVINVSKMDDVYCNICNTDFKGKYPTPGDSVDCPNCGATGYGTYDGTPDMNYDIEWVLERKREWC